MPLPSSFSLLSLVDVQNLLLFELSPSICAVELGSRSSLSRCCEKCWKVFKVVKDICAIKLFRPSFRVCIELYWVWSVSYCARVEVHVRS